MRARWTIVFLFAASVIVGCTSAGRTNGDPSNTGTGSEFASTELIHEAELAHARGRLDEAARLYALALANDPNDPTLRAAFARVEMERGDWESALQLDSPDDLVAGSENVTMHSGLSVRERCRLWLGAARSRVEAADPHAIDLLDRIRNSDHCPQDGLGPLEARAFETRASAAKERGDLAAAIEAYAAAIEADPLRDDIDLEAGRLLIDAGRQRDALEWLASALVRHPDNLELQRLMLEVLGVPVGPADF